MSVSERTHIHTVSIFVRKSIAQNLTIKSEQKAHMFKTAFIHLLKIKQCRVV